MSILISLLFVVAGFAALVYSADKFIDGASGLAHCMGVPELLIGILIVGFGTSAPEIVVSVLSALEHSPDLALGNALGSNICNISLILGCAALAAPMFPDRSLHRSEYPLLLASVLITLALGYDGGISRAESWFLLLLIAAFVLRAVRSGYLSRKNRPDAAAEPAPGAGAPGAAKRPGPGKSSLLTAGGLVFMVLSSKLVVDGAVGVAAAFGVSEVVIGLTIVAAGTSLPELTASVIAARRGSSGIAIGNIIGSNIFNNTAVIGAAGVIEPYVVGKTVLVRDGGFSLLLTLSLILFSVSFGRGAARIGRAHGLLWVGSYAAYVALLVATARRGAAVLPEPLAYFLGGAWLP